MVEMYWYRVRKNAENMKQHSCALQRIHFSLLKVLDDNIAGFTM